LALLKGAIRVRTGAESIKGIDAAFALADAIKRKGQTPVVIILTDGCVGDDWGSEWTAPTLWCIVGDYFDGEAGNGKTIHIKD
jgi:hypothetical protein